MKILFIATSYGFGGAETALKQLMKYLKEKDNEIFLCINTQMKQYFQELDITILSIPNIKPKTIFKYYLNRNNQNVQRIKRVLKKFIEENQIRSIHYVLPDSIPLVIKVENVLTYYHMHGESYLDFYLRVKSKYHKSKKEFIGAFLELITIRPVLINCLKNFNYILSTNRYFTQLLKNAGLGKKVITHYIGLKLPNNIPDNNLSKMHFNIIFVGGARKVKNGIFLLKVIKKLSGIRLYVLRDVPLNHEMRIFVRDNKMQRSVFFLGNLGRENYLAYLKSMDLICIPSLTEGIPASGIEALKLGIPIVSSNVGALKELVKDELNGYVCDLSIDDFVKKIRLIKNNDDLHSKLQRGALISSKRFDLYDRLHEQYQILIKHISEERV